MAITVFSWMAWIIVIGAMLIGLLLIILGRRGRRVGDHPHCRKCGFDLFGRPENARHCAECGADLATPRAIVTGERQRRPAALAVGAIVLVLSLATLSWMSYHTAQQIQWIQYYPIQWVIDDADNLTSPTQPAAWSELGRRGMLPELSEGDRDKLINYLLNTHSDTTKTWGPPQDDLLQLIHKHQPWRQADWDRYVGNVFSVSIDARPKLRPGTNALARVSVDLTRTFQRFDGRINSGPVMLGETAISNANLIQQPTRTSFGQDLNLHSSSTAYSIKLDASTTQPGAHELKFAVSFEVRPKDADGPTAKFEKSATQTVEVIPKNQSLVEHVDKPELRPAMEAAWVASDAVRDGDQLFIRMRIAKPPAALCMAAFARPSGEGEWAHVGDFYEEDLSADKWQSVSTQNKAIVSASAIDVVLRPSDTAVGNVPNPAVCWNGKMQREGLPVRATGPQDFLQNESLRPQVEAALYVRKAEIASDGKRINLSVGCKPVNVPLAFTAYVRIGSNEIPSGEIEFAAVPPPATGFGGGSYGFSVKLPENSPPPKKIDVVLRPRPLLHRGASLPWYGTVEFKDLALPHGDEKW